MMETSFHGAEKRMQHASLGIVVGIATSGRPHILAPVLERLRAQTRIADAVIVCGTSPTDVSGVDCGQPGLHCITSDRGLTVRYLEAVERVFEHAPDVVVGTGHVVADGILGPGLAFDDALKRLREDDQAAPTQEIADVHNAYGCNMAIRIDAVRVGRLAFDETLPLYGWLEDLDFSRRMAAYGRVVKISTARGVHLGVKSGRQPGRRLGYSQVSNPLYLVRKGTCSRRRALKLMSRNFIANFTKTFRPEPYIDRSGRLMGNLSAMLDLVVGRLSPERVLKL
jgi:hypothetical protein